MFTALDRCDRCSAGAGVRATKDGLDLIFCVHHGRELEMDLVAKGFTLTYATDVAAPALVGT